MQVRTRSLPAPKMLHDESVWNNCPSVWCLMRFITVAPEKKSVIVVGGRPTTSPSGFSTKITCWSKAYNIWYLVQFSSKISRVYQTKVYLIWFWKSQTWFNLSCEIFFLSLTCNTEVSSLDFLYILVASASPWWMRAHGGRNWNIGGCEAVTAPRLASSLMETNGTVDTIKGLPRVKRTQQRSDSVGT